MKHLLALAVALVAFLCPAQAQVQYLHSEQVVVDYMPGVPVAFDACTLAPETPVLVELRLDVRWWYSLYNRGAAISGYQYGRGVNIALHTPLGVGTLQICNNICGGALGSGQSTQQLVELFDVPIGSLSYITTAGNIPTHVSYDAYGGMQEWPGFHEPYLLTYRKRPWDIVHRTWSQSTLRVTPL